MRKIIFKFMLLINKKFFLLVCPVYEPYQSGGAQSFPLIVKALSTKYNPIVLTEFNSQKPFFEKKENVLILRIIPIRDNYGKKSFIYSLVTFFLSYLVIYVVTFFYGILGGKIFHFTRYCNFLITPLLLFLRVINVKIIYDCRTEISENQIKQFSLALKLCSYFLANSESALNSLNKYTSGKVPKVLIVNPLKIRNINIPKKFKIKNKFFKENEYIVCIGTISERKSSLKIVKAFNIAIEEISKNSEIEKNSLPKLLFVGRNDLGKNFIRFIEKFENVTYLGSKPHLESLKIIKLSLGSISASISEGIPRSCLESLYFKKPSLVPACVPEFVKYCPEVCVSTITERDFLVFIKLIKTLILNRDLILEKNKNYPINNHKYSIFKSELLKFYSTLT